jgi:hypothetical protein
MPCSSAYLEALQRADTPSLLPRSSSPSKRVTLASTLVFRLVTSGELVDRYQCFGETYCFHVQECPLEHWYLPTNPHGGTTQTNTDIFTAVKTSNLVWKVSFGSGEFSTRPQLLGAVNVLNKTTAGQAPLLSPTCRDTWHYRYYYYFLVWCWWHARPIQGDKRYY